MGNERCRDCRGVIQIPSSMKGIVFCVPDGLSANLHCVCASGSFFFFSEFLTLRFDFSDDSREEDAEL